MTIQKIAILVGVTKYNGKHDLPFCAEDVSTLANVLEDKEFSVSRIVDENLVQNVRASVTSIGLTNLTENDVIVFYYSGHGATVLQEQFLQGPNQRAPNNIKDLMAPDSDYLPLSAVIDLLSHSKALKLVIVDACRSEWPMNGVTEADFKDFSDQKRQAFQRISNCVVVYASADGKKSYGENGSGSAFTSALAVELKNYSQDFIASIQKAITSLKGATNQQIPWFYSSTFSSQFPDRLYLSHAERQPTHWSERCPRKFIGMNFHVLVGIADKALVEFNSSWTKSSRQVSFSTLGDASYVSFAYASHYTAFLRRKTVYIQDMNTGSVRSARTSSFKKAFGVSASPHGSCVAAFGYVLNDDEPGIRIWRVGARKMQRMSLANTPNLQVNAICWISDGVAYAAFSGKDSGNSVLAKIELDLNTQQGTVLIINRFAKRITAICSARNDLLLLGDIEGSIHQYCLNSHRDDVILRSHTDAAISRSCHKNWTGENDSFIDRSPGVHGISWDEKYDVCAAQYFDGSIKFVDCRSWIPIEVLLAKGRSQNRGIVACGNGLFYSIESLYGSTHQIHPI
jgi:hypothetical protein